MPAPRATVLAAASRRWVRRAPDPGPRPRPAAAGLVPVAGVPSGLSAGCAHRPPRHIRSQRPAPGPLCPPSGRGSPLPAGVEGRRPGELVCTPPASSSPVTDGPGGVRAPADGDTLRCDLHCPHGGYARASVRGQAPGHPPWGRLSLRPGSASSPAWTRAPTWLPACPEHMLCPKTVPSTRPLRTDSPRRSRPEPRAATPAPLRAQRAPRLPAGLGARRWPRRAHRTCESLLRLDSPWLGSC